MHDKSKAITSAANPAVKRLKALVQQKKEREAEGVFVVEGFRHVSEGCGGGFTLDTLAYSERAAGDAKALMQQHKADYLELTDDLLSRITGRDNTQPMLAVFKQRFTPLEALQQGCWVVLEGIRDPGNLGTIIRTCDAVKADGVMLVGDTCDPYAPETVRATMGSFARVQIARAKPAEFLSFRKGWKGRVVGTHLATDTDYRKADYSLPLLVLMGSEAAGLSDGLAKACDTLVKIPMRGGTESLNLAVSTGVMLYEIFRNKL